MSRIRQLASFDFYTKSQTDGKVVELSPPTDLTPYYNISQVDAQISSGVGGVIDGAPATLDTLREIALSIGNDNDLVGSITTLLDGKVDDSQVLTNVPSGALFTDTIYSHPTNHAISVVTGLQSALDGKVDDAQVLTNVPSGALFTDTIYSHPTNHAISEVAGLQAALDTKTTPGYVDTAITNLIGGAPGTLDTLTELATAINNDAAYASTLTTALATKVTKTTNQALSAAADALTISGSTITLARGDGTTDTVVVPTSPDTWRGISDSTSSTSSVISASSAAVKAAYDRSWPNTTYSVGDGGLTQVNFTTADKNKLDGIATSANNYSHPTTHPASMLTGALPAIDGSALTGINAVVVGATLPSPVSPEGSLFYKSDTDVFYISDGTQWNLVSNANPGTTGGTVTIGALQGNGTFSYDLGLDFTDDVDTDAQLTYTLTTGTLPAGCIMPATGTSAFTGTSPDPASNTNYTWTIKATDTSGGTATQDYQQTITPIPFGATGGTITTSGGYKYHTFTSSGSITFNKAGSVDMVIVGGGGGTPFYAGAGGGGAVFEATSRAVTASLYTITVAGGGAGVSGSCSNYNCVGNTGGTSSAFGINITGGGGGKQSDAGGTTYRGANGGGGGSRSGGDYGTKPSVSFGTAYGGFNGGHGQNSNSYPGGGGGGANGNGATPPSNGSPGGVGGPGRLTSIPATPTYYGGGGGGGTHGNSGGGAGGIGGGGQGSTGTNSTSTHGAANTGGGGGGGSESAVSYRNGGSGIVIVRYIP